MPPFVPPSAGGTMLFWSNGVPRRPGLCCMKQWSAPTNNNAAGCRGVCPLSCRPALAKLYCYGAAVKRSDSRGGAAAAWQRAVVCVAKQRAVEAWPPGGNPWAHSEEPRRTKGRAGRMGSEPWSLAQACAVARDGRRRQQQEVAAGNSSTAVAVGAGREQAERCTWRSATTTAVDCLQ